MPAAGLGGSAGAYQRSRCDDSKACGSEGVMRRSNAMAVVIVFAIGVAYAVAQSRGRWIEDPEGEGFPLLLCMGMVVGASILVGTVIEGLTPAAFKKRKEEAKAEAEDEAARQAHSKMRARLRVKAEASRRDQSEFDRWRESQQSEE